MVDADLRELENAVRAAPDDQAAQEALDRARFRLGRGWWGEPLPPIPSINVPGVVLEPERSERYVYKLTRGGVSVQMVYVPTGERECLECYRGIAPRRRASMTHWACTTCPGTGRVKIAPFYLSRFPILEREWRAMLIEHAGTAMLIEHATRVRPTDDGRLDCPACVPYSDALSFAAGLGARLPTELEWVWAALGGDGRRFPWGNNVPTVAHAVLCQYSEEEADVSHLWRASVPVLEHPHRQPTAFDEPCECTPSPARRLGASWCGAYDMYGNVRVWLPKTRDNVFWAAGLSWRRPFYGYIDDLSSGPVAPVVMGPAEREATGWLPGVSEMTDAFANDIGFRIAVSAVTP